MCAWSRFMTWLGTGTGTGTRAVCDRHCCWRTSWGAGAGRNRWEKFVASLHNGIPVLAIDCLYCILALYVRRMAP